MGKPHGLDGSFFVEDASEAPDRFVAGAVLYIGQEPAEVLAAKRAGGRPVVKLDRPAERGMVLAVRSSELPPPEADAYYVFQLVGLRVEEEGGRALGRVRDVVPGTANDVLELDSGLALPFVEACVRDVDLDRRLIVVAPGFADPL